MEDVRSQHAPHMHTYDTMGLNPVPYQMFIQRNSLDTGIVSTDGLGFRHTIGESVYKVCEIEKHSKVNLVIGASVAFGVGASGDGHTVASLLAQATGKPWFNLGVCAANSMQELITLLLFGLKADIDNVVILSGTNDCYMSFLPRDARYQQYDNYFTMGEFIRWVDDRHFQTFGLHRRIAAAIVSRLTGRDRHELAQLKKSELFKALFQKPEARPALNDDNLTELSGILQRNFAFYSMLKSKICGDVLFALQPYATWTGKKITAEEQALFDFLDNWQLKDLWATIRSRFTPQFHGQYAAMLELAAKNHSIGYADMNQATFDGFCFVDRVHLTDAGNRVVADAILNALKGGKPDD